MSRPKTRYAMDLSPEEVVAKSNCAACRLRIEFVGAKKNGRHYAILEPIQHGLAKVERGFPPLHDGCAETLGLTKERNAA